MAFGPYPVKRDALMKFKIVEPIMDRISLNSSERWSPERWSPDRQSEIQVRLIHKKQWAGQTYLSSCAV